MNEKVEKLLEKYDVESIFTTIVENLDQSKVHAGSFVLISADALKNEDIRTPLVVKKGESYVAQLEKLANDKQIMYVSALKTVRTTSGYLSEAPSSHPEEADLTLHKVPGLYTGILTVPVSILIPYRSSSDIMQQPIDDSLVAKTKIDRGTVLDNEYNNGKQPKGTRNG